MTQPRGPFFPPFAGAGLLTTGLLVLIATVALGGAAEPSFGLLPDAGVLTRWALPVVALATDIAAVLAVAALLVPVLTMHRMNDPLDDLEARAVRLALWPVVTWLLLGMVEIWLIVSDQYATPLSRTPLSRVLDALDDTRPLQTLAITCAILLPLAVGLRWVRTPRRAAFALGTALLAVVPTILTGHSASAGSHDAAVVSLLLHVLAAVLWAGGVLALWGPLGGSHAALAGRAARRFSALAAWCFGVTALTGGFNAYLRLGTFSEFFTSGYGRAALLKLVVLGVIGLVALQLRRKVNSANPTPGRGSFALLTTIELTAMAAAFGLGAALSRTAPPVGAPYPGRAESLIGGPLPPAPDLANVLLSTRLSGVGLAIVLLGSALYAAGVITLRRRGTKWPVGRTIAWFIGLATIAYATLGGLGVYGHVMFSLHMASHMVLSMLAPVLLVIGSPITLALRALPGPETTGGDGPRQMLVSFLNSRYSRIVTNPAFAAVMFIGSLYGIYFTGVYDWLMSNHLGHAFMEVHFLLAGYLYYEVLIGSAPLPKRLPHLGRLGLLVAIAPFHAFFAISIMSSSQVIGASYYELLDRPYASDLLADQNVGGSLTWALGELPLVIVAIVLLAQWFRDDTRLAKQKDRQADRDSDAELEAYNAMLTRIADNRATRGERDPATRGHEDR